MLPIVLLMLVLFPSAAGASTSSVSVTILPGPFTATLAEEDGLIEITVVDATGSGRGWWVTVDCTCDWMPLGAIQNPGGDGERGPHWDGTTLIAGPDEGMGIYRQTILAPSGRWLISSSQGGRT
jgi:hypothetical protein